MLGFIRRRPWLRKVIKVWGVVAGAIGTIKTLVALPGDIRTTAAFIPTFVSYLVVYLGYAVLGWVVLTVLWVGALWARTTVDSKYANTPFAGDPDERLIFRPGIAAAIVAIPIMFFVDANHPNEAIVDVGSCVLMLFGVFGLLILVSMIQERSGPKRP